MSVSLTTMEVLALSNFLQGLGTYSSVAEAAEALAMTGTEGAGFGGVAYTVTGGSASATTSSAGVTEIINLARAANLEASGVSVSTSGIGLVESGVGTYKAVGLLGVNLPTIAAAVAPLLGVSLGAGLYAENPSLWTKISMTLLPFCYEDTDVIPTWAEVVNDSWILSIPKALVEGLKNLFTEEGINPEYLDYTEYSEDGKNYYISEVSVGQVIGQYQNGTRWQDIQASTAGKCIVTRPFSGATLFHFEDGPTAQYSYPDDKVLPYLPISDGVKWSFDESGHDVDPLPSGVSRWSGDTPTEIPETTPAVVDPDGTTEPMTPISIPYEVPEVEPGESVPSADPEEQPDPTVTDDPEKQVDPYIQPYPVPWEVINPDADVNPEADPSQEPAKEIETPDIPETVLPDIVPSGLSPEASMPSTALSFSSDVGLVTVYHPTAAQLYAFEEWLWVTLSEADIDTVWNNPFDGVITLFELYCTPTDVGYRTIHSGFLDSEVNSAIISRYTEINCGTLGIPEYYGNYFDYSPYSKAHIYLPFIGIQELNVDDIVGHVVNVTYRIDEYNGSCIAMITVSKSTVVNGEHVDYRNTMYQFSGNCSVELPISGGSQASIKAGIMQADAYQQAANISSTAQLVGGVASLIGGIIGLSASSIGSGISSIMGASATAAYGEANALSHMLSGKSTVQKSGSFGASHGALGIKKPFITITRPKQIRVPNYNDLYGYPAHKMVMVNACTGFLRCREVHVISATASDAEKGIIESMMKSGVYVTE